MTDTVDTGQTVDQVREKLVDGVLLVLALLMIPATLLSWSRIHIVGFHPIMVLHAAVGVGLVVVALFRRRMSLLAKSWVVLGVFFLLATAGLLVFGLVSFGTEVLLLMTLLASALMGKKWGWRALAISGLTTGLIALGVSIGVITFDIDMGVYSLAPLTWVVSTALFVCILALGVTILGGIHDALLASIASLREQAAELAKARDQSEIAHRSKSAFMANVSHEFRTPLNAIVGYAELLQRKVTDERQQSELATIATSGRGLALLVDSILDLSRLEAGDIKLDAGPTVLRSFIDAFAPRYQRGATEKGLQFTWDSDGDVPFCVELDEIRMTKALGHLVDNAIKFTDDGEVSVTIGVRSRTDEIAHLVFSVRDTGVGIPENQQQAIMEPFTQADGQSVDDYGGTGIGLSLAKRLVQSMGGRLLVESREGEGSTFSIEMEDVPIVDEQ